jgi:uncharacterized protein YlxP (DUF503 family)
MARLVATVQVISPTAGVSYALPVAQVGYILMVVEAELDASGRYKIVVDSVVATDGVRYQFSKALNDASDMVDATSLAVAKLLQDSTVAQDEFGRVVQYRRAYQDATTLLDQQSLSTSKPVTDSFVSTAKAMLTPVLGKFDSTGFSDAQTRAVGKGLNDAVQWAEALARQMALAKQDGFAPVDRTVLSNSKPVNDTQTTTDYKNWQFSKSLQDAFGVNDTAVIGDGVAFTANKFVANVVTPSDRYTSALTKALTDAATATDSGLLVLQSYSDLSYFAADYVGASRSF